MCAFTSTMTDFSNRTLCTQGFVNLMEKNASFFIQSDIMYVLPIEMRTTTICDPSCNDLELESLLNRRGQVIICLLLLETGEEESLGPEVAAF